MTWKRIGPRTFEIIMGLLLIAAALGCAWLLAAWEAYEVPWFDVDPLWGLAP